MKKEREALWFELAGAEVKEVPRKDDPFQAWQYSFLSGARDEAGG